MPYFLEFGYYNTALLSSFQDFLAVILDIVQILAARAERVYTPSLTKYHYSFYYTSLVV